MAAPYPFRRNPDGSVTVWLPREVVIKETDGQGRVRSCVRKYAIKTENGVKWVQQGYKWGNDYDPA